MLTELSQEEWERVDAYRAHVLDVCLNQPLNVDELVAAIGICYAHIGQAAPRVLVAPGPLSALVWAAQLTLDPACPDDMLNLYPTPATLKEYSSDLLAQLRSGVGWRGWRHAWARHWLHVATIPGITPPNPEDLALAEAWATMTTPVLSIPLDDVCIVVDQQTALYRDRDNRLHNPAGAAWEWADGTHVYALDGIVVPEWVIMTPDAARIIRELSNVEQRRVALAHLGWDIAVLELGCEVIDTHDDPHMGTLYRLPESVTGSESPASLLVARNASPDRDGTWRTYGMLASPDASSVLEAQASLARLPVDIFLQLDGAS